MHRISLALLVASVLATTLALLPLLGENVSAGSFMGLVAFALLGIAPAFDLVGGVLLLVLRRLQLLRLWHFLVAGAVVWSIGVAAAAATGALASNAYLLATSLLAVLVGLSTIWLIAVRSPT